MDLREALQRHFGFAAFRERQEHVIERLLAGQSVLLVQATGEGKSLCYQLPALLQDGVTLVVSPLIALMEDQVAALQRRGLPAACVHSLVERSERERRIAAAERGELKLLYVTPERFRTPDFLARMQALHVPLLAVDEAHCVSRWGHDFRPDYSRLGEIRAALRNPTVLASTATATPRVREDILTSLRMPEAEQVLAGIERANLFLGVHEVHGDDEKLVRITAVAQGLGGPGIVYFALIRDLLACESELRRAGYAPIVYHGDLGRGERAAALAAFTASSDGIVLATNAFGMGIDKPDIRFILHHQIPRDLESYYQEIGRAGRDGRGSLCELLYREQDLTIQRDFVEWANPGVDLVAAVAAHIEGLGERLPATTIEDLRAALLSQPRRDGRVDTALRLLETAGCCGGALGRDFVWLRSPTRAEIQSWLPDGKRTRDLEGLLGIVRYAGATTCRKAVLHEHFGLPAPVPPCGSCDLCTDALAWLERELPPETRRPVPRTGAEASPTLRRGDWIEVDRLGLCEVLRVDGPPGRQRAEVEVAEDLRRVWIDLRRGWRRPTP